MFRRKPLPPELKHPSEMTSHEEVAEQTAMALDIAATQHAHTTISAAANPKVGMNFSSAYSICWQRPTRICG
ncbi:MAG: hypothetical protein HN341_01710 [Verrucomicrobia bacterium]|nr:hypothetical protein [Verrucomicrobiota bacterium]